jgi:thioesterase domain-containing protein
VRAPPASPRWLSTASLSALGYQHEPSCPVIRVWERHPSRDEPAARRAYARLVPEPWGPIFEPVRLSHRTSPAVRAAFVVFRHDRTMPPGYWHPQMSDRLGTPKIVEVDGDHEAMLTAPDGLAEVLLELGSDVPAPGATATAR